MEGLSKTPFNILHEVNTMPLVNTIHIWCAGVYEIRNKTHPAVYVGQSGCPRLRASIHKTDLKYNRHANKALQYAYNAGDELEVVLVKQILDQRNIRALREEEQRLISEHLKNGDTVYNRAIRMRKKYWVKSDTVAVLFKHVDTETINKLCNILECQPGDIMEYVPEEESKP